MDKKDCSSGFLLEDIVVEMLNHEIIGLQVKEMAGFVYKLKLHRLWDQKRMIL